MHLATSQWPTVMIHVLPASVGAINLAATDDQPELPLTDALVEDQSTQHPAVVRKERATSNTVRPDALNRADSRNTLTEAMDKERLTPARARSRVYLNGVFRQFVIRSRRPGAESPLAYPR